MTEYPMLNEDKMKLKKYEVALSTRNFEIELFWKRSLFFWGFIASSFVGYASIFKEKPSLAAIVACFGFVCSVAWSFANRGSKRLVKGGKRTGKYLLRKPKMKSQANYLKIEEKKIINNFGYHQENFQ